MVAPAHREQPWPRANYLELPTSAPQTIGMLLPQVLARYSLSPSNQPVQMEDRDYEGEEDSHTLAATAS